MGGPEAMRTHLERMGSALTRVEFKIRNMGVVGGDCPFDLPSSARDIYYVYDLYWQGGCSICRYAFPTGNLKKQGEKHLRTPTTWIRLGDGVKGSVPEHRFSTHPWFQPTSIVGGWESTTSGILWEPKVWIDEPNRYIYVIEQN